MECGYFAWSAEKGRLLPSLRPVGEARELLGRRWALLVLNEAGCRRLPPSRVRCRQVLLPGACGAQVLPCIEAETFVTYGLSIRDSLTYSSLSQPVLCIQRTLLRLDGTLIEPGELPLPHGWRAEEEGLALLGAELLLGGDFSKEL